jgi:protein SDA1
MLIDLLSREAAGMNSSLRKTLVQCLLLLRKHRLVELVPLLELFFRLFRVQDKALREQLYISIVSEVRRANRPNKNNALNKTLQNFMYSLFEEGASARVDSDENLAIDKILHIIIELYRKRVWDDARTVNVITDAAIKRISAKVMSTALNFFIGRFRGKSLISQPGENSDSGSEDEQEEYQHILHKAHITTSNKRATQKKLKKALSDMHRKERKSETHDQNGSFAAIHLINDPQGFIERLFGHLKKSTDPFEMKLLLMNVISRIIGTHKLLLLEFYSFLLRYIQPHQKEVTHILAYAAQATHAFVPGDIIEPLVTAIAHNFVAEHCANEIIAAGLNGLREICARCPSAMNADLLQDLAGFKGYKDKGVVMAARSLISLYREYDPEMLHRRDRGKKASMGLKDGTIPKPISYGIVGKVPHLDASHIRTEIISVENSELVKDDVVVSGSDFEEEFSEISGSDLLVESENEDIEPASFEAIRTKKSDIMSLAAQKIFDPTDFARLRKRMAGELEQSDDDEPSSESEDGYDPEVIDPRSLESSKKKKADYTERMSSIMAGREGRLKFGSRKGKHIDKASSTNRVKAKKNKNAIMLAHKSEVRAKKRRSFKEKQLVHQAHSKRQKKRR